MQAQWTHSAWQAFGQYLGNWATPCCLNRKELRIIYLTAYQEGNAACVKLNEPDIFFNINKFHKLAVKYKMKTCLFWSHFWLFWKQQILFITYGHDESNVAVVVQSLSCVWLCNSMDYSIPRLPCPSLSPGVCLNSCPLSHWCYITVSSSATLFSSCLQSFPASGSFPISWFFASGDQSIGASALASTLPMNTLTLEQQSTLGREGKG